MVSWKETSIITITATWRNELFKNKITRSFQTVRKNVKAKSIDNDVSSDRAQETEYDGFYN